MAAAHTTLTRTAALVLATALLAGPAQAGLSVTTDVGSVFRRTPGRLKPASTGSDTSSHAPVQNGQATSAAGQSRPARIVSAVPSVTEMLFAIGAGPQVVAVSSFDSHPPEVAGLPRVGGVLDPDVERILSLRPDLVVVYQTQQELRAQLARARIAVFTFKHAGLAEVLSTIREVGRRTGHGEAADRLARTIEQRLASVRQRVSGRTRPRTLLVMGRDPFALTNIYASGGTGFLHDMLDAAGGANLFVDVPRESVQATSELILARAPDVILELRGEFGSVSPEDLERDRRAWLSLASVPAVRTRRVYVLKGASFVVPGPRVADAIETIARTLHPGAGW